MKEKVITVPPLKTLIKKAPGFAKKELATYKLDITAMCGLGCLYNNRTKGGH
jgi:hypothetical protein